MIQRLAPCTSCDEQSHNHHSCCIWCQQLANPFEGRLSCQLGRKCMACLDVTTACPAPSTPDVHAFHAAGTGAAPDAFTGVCVPAVCRREPLPTLDVKDTCAQRSSASCHASLTLLQPDDMHYHVVSAAPSTKCAQHLYGTGALTGTQQSVKGPSLPRVQAQ